MNKTNVILKAALILVIAIASTIMLALAFIVDFLIGWGKGNESNRIFKTS